MLENKFISIIVPVYNAEKYLKECIDSVVKQSYQDWELILINDGSTDDSLQICKEYAQIDKRIIVIEKDNGGVSESRNIGIVKSKGEWITFLDSDDLLLPNALELVSRIDTNIKVLITGSILFENKDKINIPEKKLCTDFIQVNSALVQSAILNYPKFIKRFSNRKVLNPYNNWSCWGKFFKKEAIIENEILFNTKLKLGEDLLFCLNVYDHIDFIELCEYPYYCYRVNVSSVTHHFRDDRLRNTMQLVNEIKNIISEDQMYNYYHFVTDRVFACVRLYFLNNSCSLKDKEKASHLKSLCEEPLFKEAIMNCDYSYLSVGKKTNIANKIILFLLKHKMYRLALFCAKVI